MKNLLLVSILITSVLFSFKSLSQNYYWVGNSGNWNDLSHWSNVPNGSGSVYLAPPGQNAKVYFDANSFTLPGQTVTFNGSSAKIKSMVWNTGADAPTFTGAAADSITINGSLFLDAAMSYNFGGKLFFTGGNNDTIKTAGKQLLNDIYINTFGDTLRVVDNFNSTGGIYYQRGGLFLDNRTITCSFFNSNKTSARNLRINNTVFNIYGSGDAIVFNKSNLTKTGGTEIFNLTYTGIDTVNVSFGDTTIQWNRLNLFNRKTRFTTGAFITTMYSRSSKLIRLNFGITLKCNTFDVAGSCSGLVYLACFEGPAKIRRNAAAWTLDQFKIKNIIGLGAAGTANNSLNLGGNTGWTINENTTPVNFYWVGGNGSFYDSTHWSFSSNGAISYCVPGPNDNAIFDNSSAINTLTLNENVVIGNLDFQAISGALTVVGTADTVEVRGNLSGSSLLNMTWNGKVKLAPKWMTTTLLLSNGAIWNNNFIKTGGGQMQLTDAFTNLGGFTVKEGAWNTNEKAFTVSTFYSRKQHFYPIVLTIDSSIVTITGNHYEIDPASTTFTSLGSDLRFTNSTGDYVNFLAGFSNYSIVRVQTPTAEFFGATINYKRLMIDPGSTLILGNSSTHTADSIVAPATCSSYITIKSSNSTATAAKLLKGGYANTTFSYLIIDHVDASVTGTHTVNSSFLLNTPSNWTAGTAAPAGKKYYWYGNAGDWSDINHWSLNSGNSPANPATCLPSVRDTVIFDANSFSLSAQTVTVDAEAYFKVMDWSASTNQPTLLMEKSLTAFDDVILEKNLTVTRNNKISKLVMQPNALTATYDSDSTVINVPIALLSNSLTGIMNLVNPLYTTDSTLIIVGGGTLTTNNYAVRSGSFYIGSLDNKTINLGSTQMNLRYGFKEDPANTNLVFNCGTSKITVDYATTDSIFDNYFLSNDLTFYDVELSFNPEFYSPLTGNNSYNSLIIVAGSKINVEQGSMQTVNGPLTMNGTCRDSIYLRSSTAGSFYTFKKTTTDSLEIQCLNVKDSRFNNTPPLAAPSLRRAYFSTDAGNNTGLTFMTNVSTTANFTATSLCYGDTVQLANTSTAFQNNTSGLTFYWGFDDAPLVADTNKHYFANPGSHDILLISEYTNFCRDSLLTTVNILNPTVALNETQNDTTICLGDNFTLYAVGIPNTVTYQYFINGTAYNATPTQYLDTLTLNTFTNGNVINVVVSTGGCFGYSDSITLVVNPLPTGTFTLSDNDLCEGEILNLSSTAGNVHQYFQNGTAVSSFIPGSLNLSNLNTGDQFYAVSKITATGCIDTSATLSITERPLPTVSTFTQTDADFIICAGTPVTFTATTASTPVDYNFQVGSTVTTSTVNTFTTSNLQTGQVVSATVTDAFGCTSLPHATTYTYIVNALPVPVITATDPDLTICQGDGITFNSQFMSSYLFVLNGTAVGTASTVSSYSPSLTSNSTVAVIGTYNGCSDTSNVLSITVNTTPDLVLNVTPNDTICQGTTVDFEGISTNATSFQYFINGSSVTPISAVNTYSSSSIANNNVVSLTAYLGSCSKSISIPFTVNPLPTPTLLTDDSDNTICETAPITFTGANASTYEFFVGGVSQSTTSPFTTSSLPSGTNSVYVVGTNSFNCSAASPVTTIAVTALPSVSLTSSDADNTICSGAPVTFTASGGATDYQFILNGTPQGAPSPVDTFTISSLPTTNTIEVIAYNGVCSNPGTNTISTTVNPIPVASLTSSSGTFIFCQGAPVTITAGTGTSYEFIIDGVSAGVGTNNIFDGSTLNPGNHTVQVKVTTNGCIATTSANVTVLTNPSITLTGLNAICSGQSVTYNSSGASTYEFSVNGTVVQALSSLSSYTSNSMNNGDVLTVTGQSLSGCAAQTTPSITIGVSPTPSVTLVSDDLDGILCSGQTVNFTASGATTYSFYVNGAPVVSSGNIYTTNTLTSGQTVSVIGTSNSCPSLPAPLTVSVYNNPNVSLVNLDDTTLCVDELTQLQAVGASEYLFYINGVAQGSFGFTSTFNSLLNHGDIVSVEGRSNTCVRSASDSIQFAVFNYPTTQLSSSDADNAICYGTNVQFTGTGAMTYEYFVDGNSVSAPGNTYNTTLLEDGQVVTLVGYNGDCAFTAPQVLNFTVYSLDITTTVNPADYMICEGEVLTITAAGADEYEIFVNGVSQGSQSTTNTFALGNLAQNDQITLNGFSNSTGCIQQDDETVIAQVFEGPVISYVGNTTICEGDSIILHSNATLGNQWYLNGTAISGATDTMLVVFNTGDYSLEVTNGGTGELWSVGYNTNGELANGNNFNSAVPSEAMTLTDLQTVRSGSDHAIALTNSGQVYSWGSNSSGQLGISTFTASNVPVQVTAVPVTSAVAAGANYSVAVSSTGQVFVWGDNNFGQLGLGNTVVYNTPQLVTSVSGITAVAAGSEHSLLLKSDGTVWAAGNNDFGQLGNGSLTDASTFTQVSGLSNIVKIEAGDYHSLAINDQNQLFVWGNNSEGQLGLNDLNHRLVPTLSGVNNVKTVSAGNAHTLIATTSGKLYTTGSNNFGQLGTGSTADQDSPQLILSLNAVADVKAGAYHSLILKNDGSVWGMGRNDNSQLGELTGSNILSPSIIPSVEGVTSMDGGKENSHFIFGNDAVCVSSVVSVTMLSAPKPTIFSTGNVLSTTATGVSYEWFINSIPIVNSNSTSVVASEIGYYTIAVTYANGCTSLSDPFNYGVVGIESELSSNAIKAYPNPTKDIVNIEWSEIGSCSSLILSDALGRVVLESIPADNQLIHSIDMTSLSKGVYHLQVQMKDDRKKLIKLVKE
jgi:alpha-tubulin suppressor-like RCC1 family protein